MNIQKLLLLLFPVTFAAKLPSFINKCDRKDPNFGRCAVDIANFLIPKLVKGHKDLRFPPISPFHIEEIQIEATETLKLKLEDVDIFGLEKAKFLEITCDFEAMVCRSQIFFSELEVKGTCDIDGQVMILPIKGHGAATIKIVEGVFDISLGWTLYKKAGQTYTNLGDIGLHYKTKRSYFHFDDLFNGDKALGDQMNDFLNDNWQELSKEVEPAVSRTIQAILKELFGQIADAIAYDDLFL